jgi:hypothetical protein
MAAAAATTAIWIIPCILSSRSGLYRRHRRLPVKWRAGRVGYWNGAHCDSVTKVFKCLLLHVIVAVLLSYTSRGMAAGLNFGRAAHLVAGRGVMVAVRLVLIRNRTFSSLRKRCHQSSLRCLPRIQTTPLRPRRRRLDPSQCQRKRPHFQRQSPAYKVRGQHRALYQPQGAGRWR